MSMFIGGVISIVIFYILILSVGIWAGRKQKSTEKNPDTEEIMLAGRNIGTIVGIFTMTGNFLNNFNHLFWMILIKICFKKQHGSVVVS